MVVVVVAAVAAAKRGMSAQTAAAVSATLWASPACAHPTTGNALAAPTPAPATAGVGTCSGRGLGESRDVPYMAAGRVSKIAVCWDALLFGSWPPLLAASSGRVVDAVVAINGGASTDWPCTRLPRASGNGGPAVCGSVWAGAADTALDSCDA